MAIAQKLEQLDGAIGSWWLSTSPDVRHPGVIRRDGERGVWTLAVYGSLLGPAGMEMKGGPGCRDQDVGDRGLRIFGVTVVGDVTLPMSSRTGQRGGGRDRREEEWQSFTALLGKQAGPEQRWIAMRFELPLVWDWFSPTTHEPREQGHKNPLDGDPEQLSADWKGFTVVAWRGTEQTLGRRKRGKAGVGGFTLEHQTGFLLEDVEKPMLALQSLHEVLYGEPSTPEGQTLQPVGSPRWEEVFELPARRAVIAQPAIPDPYFGTGEVDFASFIPAWINLHVEAEVWPSIGSPPGAKSWIQTMVVESVNAAESLARHLRLGRDDPTAREIDILNAISGLPKRTQNYAQRALRIARDTLQQQLETLALTIGPSSATWLLGDVKSWSAAVAQSRNALSHGFASKMGLERDPQSMWSMLTSLKVVQRLAMLRTAGFANGQTDADVELLVDSAGSELIRHPNSTLARDLEWIHNSPKAWIQNGQTPD